MKINNSKMLLNEIIEKIVDSINNINIPNFYIIKSSTLPFYTIDQDPEHIGIDIKIILKEKKKKKPKEEAKRVSDEAKRVSDDMFAQHGRVQIGGEKNLHQIYSEKKMILKES